MTELDLTTFIAAKKAELEALAKQAEVEPWNRAQCYVDMAQCRDAIQKNEYKLRKLQGKDVM